MVERRRHFRFEPNTHDDELAVVENHLPAGVVSNYSRGGMCLVLHAGELDLGQEVVIDYRGHTARAIVRNVTHDPLTTAYGMEWIQPIPSAMLPPHLTLLTADD